MIIYHNNSPFGELLINKTRTKYVFSASCPAAKDILRVYAADAAGNTLSVGLVGAECPSFEKVFSANELKNTGFDCENVVSAFIPGDIIPEPVIREAAGSLAMEDGAYYEPLGVELKLSCAACRMHPVERQGKIFLCLKIKSDGWPE